MKIHKTFSVNNGLILTFNLTRRLMYINAVCLKYMPDMDYALIMISAPEKRFSLYPCGSDEHDAVRVRSAGSNRNKPRYIHCCNDFLDKMLVLMNWSSNCCYRITGYIAKSDSEIIAAFDLASAEIKEGG